MDYNLHLVFTENRDQRSTVKRFVPTRKTTLVLNIFEGYEKMVYISCISFEAVKPLGHVEIVPSPYVTESTRVALLVPTFEHQIKECMDFIAHYEKTCMEHQDNTFLMLVNECDQNVLLNSVR